MTQTRLDGWVEEVHAHHATGWAADVAEGAPVSVTLHDGDKLLARTVPIFARPDVEAAMAVCRQSGFYLAYENIGTLLKDRGAHLAVATDGTQPQRLPLVEAAFRATPDQYQSFGTIGGGTSRSQMKLGALRLELLDETALQPRRILDIGCNEGFFCDALARRYPDAMVLGVDSSAVFIERAQRRFPHIEFVTQSWWDVEQGDFDIILFLSAVHYEPDQAGLFGHLRRKLSRDGVLILECGVAEELAVGPAERWLVAHRHDGFFRYPSYRHLTEALLSDFSCKYIGQSPAQEGDLVCRHVLHCRPRRQGLILLSGRSGTGKSELCRTLLASPDIQVIYTDVVIQRLLTDPYLATAPLALQLRVFFGWPANLELVHRCILDHALLEDFVDLLLLGVDAGAPTVVIEGALLDFPGMGECIARQAARWFRIWRLD